MRGRHYICALICLFLLFFKEFDLLNIWDGIRKLMEYSLIFSTQRHQKTFINITHLKVDIPEVLARRIL